MAVTLIASGNMFSYYSRALLEEFVNDTVHAHFVRKLNYSEIDNFIEEDTTIVLILGLPFYSSQRTGLKQKLEEMDFSDDIPFTDVIHISNWGDPIDLPGVTSIVEGEPSLITLLADYLTNGEGLLSSMNFNAGAKKLITYLESYHKYDFVHHKASAPLSLKLLADVYRDRVYKAVRLTDTDVEFDTDLRDSLYEHMEEYIYGVVDKTEVELINGTVVALVYAEDYHNEVANKIMVAYRDANFPNVVVFIGKETRGDDMFHIRVSNESLNAESIAKFVNNGKGNSHASTVFLGRHRKAEINILKTKLSNYF